MCLISKNKRPKTAKQDIECFKVLKQEKDTPENFKHIYYTVIRNQMVVAGTFVETGRKPATNSQGCSIVEGGWFHSFKDKKQADEFCKLGELGMFNYVTVRAVIPKGAKYYEGVALDKSDYKCYASDMIRYPELP